MSQPASRTYERHTCIAFRKTTEQFGGLSNMAPGFPLRVNGALIRTSEALYQACRFPHRPDIQRLIIEQASPMTAKMKSKPYRAQSRSDWDNVRVKIMTWCLRVKLAQHWKSFGELLLATKDLAIVEESAKDDFWGAKAVDANTLVGKNVLGRLLMKVREELRGPHPDTLRHVEPLAIPNFLLLGQPITAIGTLATRDSSALAHDESLNLPHDRQSIPPPIKNSSRQGDWLSPREVASGTYRKDSGSSADNASLSSFIEGRSDSILIPSQITEETLQSYPVSLGGSLPSCLDIVPSEVIISRTFNPANSSELDEFLRSLRERLSKLDLTQDRLELVVYRIK